MKNVRNEKPAHGLPKKKEGSLTPEGEIEMTKAREELKACLCKMFRICETFKN